MSHLVAADARVNKHAFVSRTPPAACSSRQSTSPASTTLSRWIPLRFSSCAPPPGACCIHDPHAPPRFSLRRLLFGLRFALQGKRRYDHKQRGFGGQTKPIFHKKVCKLACVYQIMRWSSLARRSAQPERVAVFFSRRLYTHAAVHPLFVVVPGTRCIFLAN